MKRNEKTRAKKKNCQPVCEYMYESVYFKKMRMKKKKRCEKEEAKKEDFFYIKRNEISELK